MEKEVEEEEEYEEGEVGRTRSFAGALLFEHSFFFRHVVHMSSTRRPHDKKTRS